MRQAHITCFGYLNEFIFAMAPEQLEVIVGVKCLGLVVVFNVQKRKNRGIMELHCFSSVHCTNIAFFTWKHNLPNLIWSADLCWLKKDKVVKNNVPLERRK